MLKRLLAISCLFLFHSSFPKQFLVKKICLYRCLNFKKLCLKIAYIYQYHGKNSIERQADF